MDEGDRIERWTHSANNCRQLLVAMQRRLDRALPMIEAGETQAALEMLHPVSEALPRAMELLDPDAQQGDRRA